MIKLKALTPADIVAHNLGEDAETVRWLTGEYGTEESTRQHFERLANNASSGLGARGFGVWAEERLAGYIECDPDLADLPAKGDVNVSYSIHPWARRRGIATAAVEIICEFMGTYRSRTDRHLDGSPMVYQVYSRDLHRRI